MRRCFWLQNLCVLFAVGYLCVICVLSTRSSRFRGTTDASSGSRFSEPFARTGFFSCSQYALSVWFWSKNTHGIYVFRYSNNIVVHKALCIRTQGGSASTHRFMIGHHWNTKTPKITRNNNRTILSYI